MSQQNPQHENHLTQYQQALQSVAMDGQRLLAAIGKAIDSGQVTPYWAWMVCAQIDYPELQAGIERVLFGAPAQPALAPTAKTSRYGFAIDSKTMQ